MMASGSAQKTALCKRAPCAARAMADTSASGSAAEGALYSRWARREVPRRAAAERQLFAKVRLDE